MNNSEDFKKEDDMIENEKELFDEEDYLSPKKDKPSRGKTKITKGSIVRHVIMVMAACVFLYSAGMLIKIFLEYKEGEDIYNSIADSVFVPATLPDEPQNVDDPSDVIEVPPFKYDHQALLNINRDGVGYLYMPAINLRLPVVQGTDNEYYLTYTFNRVNNGAGTLFVDYRIRGGIAANHVIIYGHNMRDGSMFAGLYKYLTPSFYRTEGNDTFYIYTEDKLREYKIFSAYISEPVSDTYVIGFPSTLELRAYASSMKELSSYNMGVDVSETDQIVTLSTCTGDGEDRVIVQGIFVGESILE